VMLHHKPATTPPFLDDEPSHIVCCVDENIGLCGTDLTNVPWVDDDTPTGCVVCSDLHDVVTFCPKGGKCTGGVQ